MNNGPVVVFLPPFLTAARMNESVEVCNQLSGVDQDVIVDASHLQFIDPLGIALLGATFYALQSKGTNVKARGLNTDQASYLHRMDVFKGVELEECSITQNIRHAREGSLVELTRLDKPREINDVASRLAHALVGHMPNIDLDEEPDEMTGQTATDLHQGPIEYALSELLENSLTHARKYGNKQGCVWVACQYYPTTGMVRLGVVDSGCGFLATLSKHRLLREQSHLEAILLALEPMVSCNRDLLLNSNESVNQGVGLTTTLRIAKQANGRLVIASGDAKHDTRGHSIYFAEGVHWQGVAIAMECQRTRLPSIKIADLLPRLDTPAREKLRFE